MSSFSKCLTKKQMQLQPQAKDLEEELPAFREGSCVPGTTSYPLFLQLCTKEAHGITPFYS